MIGSAFDDLVVSLQCLPSVGVKSARKMALQLMIHKPKQAQKIAKSIENALVNIKQCTQCSMLTEYDVCSICSNEARTARYVCLVASPYDVMTLSRIPTYTGKFFVLNAMLSPLDGIGPEQAGLLKFQNYIEQCSDVEEVVIALNTSLHTQATLFYINQCVERVNQSQERSVQITTFATGVPIGADIDYLDTKTLATALKNRIEFSG